MKFGLPENTIKKLTEVFEANPKVDKAIVFGSRAKGNYKPDSDIDIALKGFNLSVNDILKMKVALDEAGIKNSIDLIDYNSISAKDLIEHIDRVGIELFSKRIEYKLGEIVNVINGYAFKSKDFIASNEQGTLPIVKIKNVANGDVNLDDVQYHLYSNNLEKFTINKGDILIALTGNHPELETQVVGLVSKYKLNQKALLNQRVAKIVPKQKEILDKEFLYYFLKDKNTHQYLSSQSAGSANQANISKKDIDNTPILLPPIFEQEQIASTLSSLDNKIDLLQRQNRTLEQLAEALFKQWFVEEAEVVKIEKLGDIAVVQNGYAFSSKDYVVYHADHLEVLKMGHIEKGSGLRTDPKRDFVPREEKLKRWTLNKTDLVMAMTDMKDNVVILGVPAMIDKSEHYVLNQRVARIYLASNKKLLNNYFLYLQLKDSEFIAKLQSKANSGVQVNLSTEAIKDCDLIIPPMKLQEGKGTAITELYYKKENNDNQIKTLTQLRVTLLPKLMSGEIRIEE